MTESQDVVSIELTSPEGEAALRLRKRYWVNEYAWKADSGNEFESDEFDPYSGHFCYLDGDELVGYCRFIPNRGTLPLVAVFPKVQAVIDGLGSSCGEYSRLIIEPTYRGGDLSLYFYRAVFAWTRPRGHNWWLFEVEQWMIDLFRQLHFVVEVLDDPVFYQGVNGHPDQWTFPVLLDVEKSFRGLETADPQLFRFIQQALDPRPA